MTDRGQVFEELRKIVAERSKPFVFWTGAGISAPTIPSWGGLLSELISAAKDKTRTISDNKYLNESIRFAEEQTDLWVAFERLASSDRGVGQETFKAVVRRSLSPSQSGPIPLVHSLLWKLKPKGIVTLNLDLFTLRASAEVSKGENVAIQIQPGQFGQNISVFKEIRSFIAYPHGYYDRTDTWTFTNSTLRERLSDDSYNSWVTALFASHVVIFVGLTVDDIAVGGLLERLSRSGTLSFSGNFWITHRNDSNTDRWAEDHGIRVIRYEYDEDSKSHKDLEKLILEISDYKPVENIDLEKPVSPSGVSFLSQLDEPDKLDLHNKEYLRMVLNGYAKYIYQMYKDNDTERDVKFREFLTKYDDAVHNAYHTSINSGKNKFLGYTLLSGASRGAFGTVYQATDPNGEYVAIKILHAEKLDDTDFYRNFRRGVNSLKILRDRQVEGIVKFIDAVEIPPALIMEWIEGVTLSNIVHRSSLETWREKLVVLCKLAKILRTSHSLPERVLHRDLRPANIMIRDFYTNPEKLDVVVLDFDLSWHRGAEDHSIMYSPALGYLAPEQRRRINHSTTRTTLVDSYGFGMVMSFVMTGSDPIPDAHLIPTWMSDLENKITFSHCKEWKCIPRRIFRLIAGSIKEYQNERYEMPYIQGELENLIGYIDHPTDLSSTSILAEELAMRTQHMQGYVWDEINTSAKYQTTAEKSISISADMPRRIIVLKIEWKNAGTQDWGQINRLLDNGVPKMISCLKDGGWDAVSQHKESRSFTITGEIYAEDAVKNLEKVANYLDSALKSAFSLGGYS